MTEMKDTEKEARPPFDGPAGWVDLALYLGVGIGLFVLLSLGVGRIFQEVDLLRSILAYSLNVLVFVGVVYVLAVRRGWVTWKDLGLVPPRWDWRWLPILGALTIGLIPLRSCIGATAQYLLRGDFESLTLRGEVFSTVGESWWGFIVTLLMAGVLVPIAEELFFRGLIYTWFRRRYEVWVAVLASALLFGLGHIDAAGVVVASFVMGTVNALVFERTRSLWAAIAVHAINNSAAMILLFAALRLAEDLPMP